MDLWLIPLGIIGGALTTLAGLGGGLVMTLVLSAVWEPARALAVAAPALLTGNVQRVAMYRRFIERRSVLPFVAGAAPGALVGGSLAVELPEGPMRALLLGAAVLAVIIELDLWKWRPGPTAIVPASFVTGALTATTGSGGLLLGPLLLASGLKGERFVVSASLVALSIHVARIVAYGAGGLIDAGTLRQAALLAVSIVLGNLAGSRLRSHLDERRGTLLSYGVLLAGVALALAGLH